LGIGFQNNWRKDMSLYIEIILESLVNIRRLMMEYYIEGMRMRNEIKWIGLDAR